MRRLVTPLLALGAALLVAALVWPTDRMVLESPGGAVTPLLDIWLWGRVRPLTEFSSTRVDGSLPVLVALVVAAGLALAGAAVWRRPSRGRAPGRTRAAVATLAVGAALVTAVVAVSTDVTEFGWVTPGGLPTFTRTVVATFPLVAFVLWAAALALMVVLLWRRGGRDEGPGDPAAA